MAAALDQRAVAARTYELMTAFVNPMADNATIHAIEAELHALGSVPGFASVLLALLQQQDPAPLPQPLRQFIAVLLRRSVVAKHWNPLSSEEGEAVFTVPAEEKALLRGTLPKLLQESDGKVRDGIAAVLGDIAKEDWPDQWPGFVEQLVQTFQAVSSSAAAGGEGLAVQHWLLVDGALRCLEVFMDSISTEQMPALAGALFPSLIAVAQGSASPGGPQYGCAAFALSLRHQAFALLRTGLGTLESYSQLGKKAKKEVASIMKATGAGIIQAAVSVLQLFGWNGRLCGLKHQAFALLCDMAVLFPSTLKPLATPVATAVLALATAAMPLWRAISIDDEEAEAISIAQKAAGAAGANAGFASLEQSGLVPGPCDSFARPADNEEEGLDVLLLDFARFLQLCMYEKVSIPVLNSIPQTYLKEVVQFLVSMCQLDDNSLAAWEDEPDAFIREQLDEVGSGVSLRGDAKDLLMDLHYYLAEKAGGQPALVAITQAVAQVVGTIAAGRNPADLAAAAPFLHLSRKHSWKAAEACLYLVGLCRKELLAFHKANKQAAAAAAGAGAGAGAAAASSTKKSGSSSSSKKGGAAGGAGAIAGALAIDIPSFINLLIDWVGKGAEPAFLPGYPAEDKKQAAPYVLGRALWCASRLVRVMSQEQSTQLLMASAEGLQLSHGVPIRLAACQAVGKLLQRVPLVTAEALATTLLQRIHALILGPRVSEDSVQYYLEVAVKTLLFAPAARAATEESWTNLFIALWFKFATHPILSRTVALALETSVEASPDAASLAALSRLLPTLISILAACVAYPSLSPSATGAGGVTLSTALASIVGPVPCSAPAPILLAEGACDLLRRSIRKYASIKLAGASNAASAAALQAVATGAGAAAGSGAAAPSVQTSYVELDPALVRGVALCCQLLRVCDGGSVIEPAASCLSAAVRVAGPHLLTEAAAGQGLSRDLLLGALVSLLEPSRGLSDSSIMSVAPLATSFTSHLPIPGLGEALLPPLVTRLSLCSLASPITRLITAISHALIKDGDSSLKALAQSKVQLPQEGLLSAFSDGGPLHGVTAAAAGGAAAGAGSGKQQQQQALSPAEQSKLYAAALSAGDGRLQQSGLVVFLRAVSSFYPSMSSIAALAQRLVLQAILQLVQSPEVVEGTMALQLKSDKEADGSEGMDAASGGGMMALASAFGVSTRTARGMRTRSSGPVQHLRVPAPVRLLELLVKDWALRTAEEEEEAEEDITDEDEGEEGDGEEEEEDGGEGEEELEEVEAGRSSSRKGRGAGSSAFLSADDAAALYGLDFSTGGGKKGGKGSRKNREDADLACLADLICGGDGGTGTTLAQMLQGVDAEDDSDDEDGSGDDGRSDGSEEEDAEGGAGSGPSRRPEDLGVSGEDLREASLWDEVEDIIAAISWTDSSSSSSSGSPSASASASGSPQQSIFTPADPVIRAIMRSSSQQALATFLSGLVQAAAANAKSSSSAGAVSLASLLQAVSSVLPASDREVFVQRIVNPVMAAVKAAGGSRK